MSRNAFDQCAREIEEREEQRHMARAERMAAEGYADVTLKVVPQYVVRDPKQVLDIVGPSRHPDYFGTKIAEAMYDADNLGFYVHSLKEAEANARRLVACWNACAGMSTADLELIASLGGRLQAKAVGDNYRQQRDKYQEDAERWQKLCEAIDENKATATVDSSDGKLRSICLNSNDLTDAIDELTEDNALDFELEPPDDPRALAADHYRDTRRDDELTGDR